MIDQEICVLSVEKELKILFDTKKCYLFTNLVEEIYEIYCVEEEVDDNKKIKYFLLTNFQDNLQFTPAHWIDANSITVYYVEVDPVDYAMALIIETGLRDKEITLAFAKMINHRLNSQVL